VTEKLQELSIPELEINMMVLAVDEICANLIIHSNNSNQDQHLELTIKDESQGIIFEIMDKGAPFDVSAYEIPEIDDLVKTKRKGGLGLMLVKRIMDQIEFRKEKDFNVLRMFKKVSFSN
jgi:serine/threonine-protein kinase RsbW